MLEVYSPIPLQEGESLAFGINTKHVLHFAFGLGASSPFVAVAAFVLPMLHEPRWGALFLSVGTGLIFTTMKLHGRSIADVLWLSIRFSWRPKVILYDRQFRIRTHRKVAFSGR